MFRKISAVLIAVSLLLLVSVSVKSPVFKEYAKELEVYSGENSSLASILTIATDEFYQIKNVKGESFKVRNKEFNVEEFLLSFSARVVFTEEIKQGTSYYAYSPKISYRAVIKGKVINLQIVVGDEITVGSPIIYGSF